MKKINSIVVTTFNHSQFIAQCIESILNQNVEDLEIIVVDDGSSDDTPLIVAKYAMEGVRLYEKANGGPSTATNFGIDKTQGKYIFILSGDDVLLPNSIATRVEALSHPAVNIVTSVPFWINDAGRRLRGDEYQPIFSNPGLLTPLQLFEKLLFQGNFICAPSVAFTRNCWITVGRFNELLWQLQDYEYWLRAAAAGFRIHFIDEPLIEYRSHENNLSTLNRSRLEWEIDMVMPNAPTFLSQADVQQLLFGEGFRNIDLGIEREFLLPFVSIKNSRQSVAAIGQWQLSKMAGNQRNLQVLSKKMYLG